MNTSPSSLSANRVAVSARRVLLPLVIIAFVVAPAMAQTRYGARILSLAAGATGGSVAAIGGGQAAGSNSFSATITSGNGFTVNTTVSDAALWTDANTVIDLLPFDQQLALAAALGIQVTPNSAVTGVAAGVQSGFYTPIQAGIVRTHAALWAGTPGSLVDLDPGSAFAGSAALGACVGQQAGYVGILQFQAIRRGVFREVFVGNHAAIWSGASGTMIDLHNSGSNSYALACDSGVQVGYFDNGQGQTQACLWHGTRNTQVNLHTGPWYSTRALAVSGNVQVGIGTLQGATKTDPMISHAIMWNGTSGSLRDLHPAGFSESFGMGAGDGKQVGYGTNTNGIETIYDALVWSGSAASVINLNQFLPTGYSDARATSIDAAGNIAGIALGPNGWQPVIWSPITP